MALLIADTPAGDEASAEGVAARGWTLGQLAGRSILSQIILLSCAVLVPMLVALVILVAQVERMHEAALDVKAAYGTINVGQRLVRQFAEIQLAVHAYVLTGDARFLDAYQDGRREWSQAEAAASGSILRDPDRAERLMQVEQDVDAFFTDWENRLGILVPGGNDLAAREMIDQDDKRVRRIRASIADFVRREENGIHHRLAAEERARDRVYAAAVLTSLFAVAVLAAFATLLGRSIARPIQGVASAAGRLGAGHWDERVQPVGGRETRTLAVAFNQMADALHEARASVAARNRELEASTQRLATANEDLRDRQREADDFLYVLSHDLRAPLINIQGFGRRLHGAMGALESSLKGMVVSEETRRQLHRMLESLKFINAGAGKIDQLIARLLEIARLATRPDQRRWVDMGRVAREVIGACQFQLRERGIEASIGTLPTVYGDPVQLNQVLTNLIDNAIKYMGDGPVRQIAVSCSVQGDRYRFAVQDTGPGIAAKDKEKVFRMFARLHPGAAAGEGIGLAAVRTIVNRHGGRIWVESEPGQGSTFYFTLPREAQVALRESVGNGAPPIAQAEEARRDAARASG